MGPLAQGSGTAAKKPARLVGGNTIPATFTSNSFGFNYVDSSQDLPATVPEPANLTLVGLGAVGLAVGAIRRRRQRVP